MVESMVDRKPEIQSDTDRYIDRKVEKKGQVLSMVTTFLNQFTMVKFIVESMSCDLFLSL